MHAFLRLRGRLWWWMAPCVLLCGLTLYRSVLVLVGRIPGAPGFVGQFLCSVAFSWAAVCAWRWWNRSVFFSRDGSGVHLWIFLSRAIWIGWIFFLIACAASLFQDALAFAERAVPRFDVDGIEATRVRVVLSYALSALIALLEILPLLYATYVVDLWDSSADPARTALAQVAATRSPAPRRG